VERMARKAPVRVKAVVCLRCTRGLMRKKPVEMDFVETLAAEGTEDHLVGIFECKVCGSVVGFIHQEVRIFKDGTVIGKAIEEYNL